MFLIGDCLDLMARIPDKSVDLVLCDLPYGTTKCSWDIVIPFEHLWECYHRICKPNAAILLFGTEPFSSSLRLSNLKDYRYDWIWNKKRAANFLFMNKMPGKVCEYISVFYKKQPTYNPQKIQRPGGIHKGSFYKNPNKITENVRSIMGDSWKETELGTDQNYKGKNYEPDKLLPNNLLEFVKDTKRLHPTQKPVTLCEYLIKTYSNTGDLILDNCAGSGTTGVAADNLDRKWILIEKDASMASLAIKRINQNRAGRGQRLVLPT